MQKPITEIYGEKIAQFLNLKKTKEGRYNTTYGTKTDTGLYLSIIRFLEENCNCQITENLQTIEQKKEYR